MTSSVVVFLRLDKISAELQKKSAFTGFAVLDRLSIKLLSYPPGASDIMIQIQDILT